MNPEKNLQELGLTLPQPPAAAGAYVPAVRTGNLLYLAGTLPMRDGKMAVSYTHLRAHETDS